MAIPEASLSATLAARVEEIVGAAEREADALVRQRVQRIHELTGELIDRAEAAQRGLDELIGALEQAAEGLERTAGAGAPDPPAALRAAIRTPADLRASQRPTDPALEAARLVAIEMAVAGRTRPQVAHHLRDAFPLADTEGILDDVFGGAEGGRTADRDGASQWRQGAL